VTTATIFGIAPYPLDTNEPEQQEKNRIYLENWMDRFLTSRLKEVNPSQLG
ncbi:MAG: CO2 hydration protein, partial [Coleofasciculaceae cyanobacterium]